MATKKQIRANQANARRSTGPHTPEGKAKSSQNALKHGLRAKTTVLPDENLDDFDVLVSELEDEFQPATAIEWILLRQLADAEWRMRRVPLIEAGVLAKHFHELCEHYDCHPDQLPDDPEDVDIFLIGAMAARDAHRGDVLAKLSRYESRLSHRYFKALAHLRGIQDRRASTQNRRAASSADNPACAGPANLCPSTAPTEHPKPQPPPASDRGAIPPSCPQSARTNPIPPPPRPAACSRSKAFCYPKENRQRRSEPHAQAWRTQPLSWMQRGRKGLGL
jgi:hypothetical protein